MTDQETLALFKKTGALLEGHFLLSSGLHSKLYLQCALLLAHPQRAGELGAALAALCPEKPDLVVSPAMGGLIIGHEVARALGVRHYFTERDNGVVTLRRGFAVKPGERALVVEDVVTTGKSSMEVVDLLASFGAKAIALASIVDRSRGEALPVPRRSLLSLSVPTYQPKECPLCAEGLPFIKPGSRTTEPKK